MGQEIHRSRFSGEEFAEFSRRLAAETELLAEWERAGRMCRATYRLGFELEAWLVDRKGAPAPRNGEFFEQLNDPMVGPELARFNFEINDEPLDFAAGMFDRMQTSLLARWRRCAASARHLGMRALSIGMLPTLRLEMLNLDNISDLSRYRVLNREILHLRRERPIDIDIQGVQRLALQHHDVMLESATASLQIHLQVGSERAARAFNAAKMVSAATLALAANSPYFLGHRLWQETRIPLFEQAIAVGHSDYSKRVTFGIGYADQGLLGCFAANRERYPVLLPDLSDAASETLAHLRLHNGTIWRWNRPLVGFDAAGRPHYRIEHRVMAAGTSVQDVVANSAFFVGLMSALIQGPEPLEAELPFEIARRNFYRAARLGLDASVTWRRGASGPLHGLILEELLPLADQGLRGIGLEASERAYWLGIIAERTRTRRTGAAWQVAWVARHGEDWEGLVRAYAEQQDTGEPVHRWRGWMC